MKKDTRIQSARFLDAEIIAFIVSQGNKDVAEKFELRVPKCLFLILMIHLHTNCGWPI
jgi:hypothetical protein